MPFNPNFPSVPSNPPSWSNAGDGFPDDWIAPAATSIGNPWAAPRQAPLNDGFPDDWITPTATGDRLAAPRQAPLDDGFPDDWIAPTATPTGNSWAAPRQ